MEKKRDREQGGILGGVAELFDLPQPSSQMDFHS